MYQSLGVQCCGGLALMRSKCRHQCNFHRTRSERSKKGKRARQTFADASQAPILFCIADVQLAPLNPSG
ncbi:hypothetical protein PPTG_20698 [Phytophthora nicotianae INRA-310]|uniref:Uncharacterized protein n=1 Tax=Phytophthora nicotianae (strain INRA-310) TaxID=761204 RepID=W2RGP4_PHYN3|nr:hypothetical protein PPTG_20698 [Phytophthora nicotianae INRA-310]ETN23735.1 hypothetical protein PPTG_20698 [Phytophthora nicotianae INRA-310]